MAENTPELELFEHLEDLVFIHDLQGSICYVNRYVQKFLGYSPTIFSTKYPGFSADQVSGKYFNYLQSLKSKSMLPGCRSLYPKGRSAC